MAGRRDDGVPWRRASSRRTINNDPDGFWRDFEVMKFEVNNYYAYYRRGLLRQRRDGGDLWSYTNAKRNPDSILYTGVNEFRRIRGPWDNIYDMTRPTNRGGRFRLRAGPGAGPNRDETSFLLAASLQRSFNRVPIPIRIMRVLGNGGNGVAFLCDTPDTADSARSRKRFVIKADRRGRISLSEEKDCMMVLKRAPHITQMLRFKELNPMVLDEKARRLDEHDGVQLLEFCKHGDLLSFVEKAADTRIGQKQVLKIFACLIRACIAMQYPPRRLIARNGNRLDDAEIGNPIQEAIPPPDLRDDCAYNLVHFDLDPQNILLGDLDESEHSVMPVCKVADFGLAKRTTSSVFDNAVQAMEYRRMGKPDHPLPEQFHKEWEFVDILPQNQTPPPRIAGRYGSASNVFAIGLCMHTVITGCTPPDPLETIGPLNHDNSRRFLPEDYHSIRDAWGVEVEPFYTYGSWLLEPGIDLSPVVIGLLFRCLADQPADRPSLDELVRWVAIMEDFDGNKEPDGFYDRIFGQPADLSTDIFSLFPDFRPFALDNDAPGPLRDRIRSQPRLEEDTRSRSTIWMGPPRPESAPGNLGNLPASSDRSIGPSPPLGPGGGGDGDDGSSSSYQDDDSGGNDGLPRLDASPANDSAGNDGSSWLGARPADDSAASDESSSGGQTASRQGGDQRGSVQEGSNQGSSEGGRPEQASAGQQGAGQQSAGQQDPDPSESDEDDDEDINPSTPGSGGWLSFLTSRPAPAATPSQADLDRMMISSDEDDSDDDDQGATFVLAPNANDRRGNRFPASAAAQGRSTAPAGDPASALRAARRSASRPSRLARLLARLRIRPLPPSPARQPPPDRQTRRASRFSRLGLTRTVRPTAAPMPVPGSGPAPAPSLSQRMRRPRRRQDASLEQPARSTRPDRSRAARPAPTPMPAPTRVAGQPGRLRRVGRLPERRGPRLGSQQGIPYPNAARGEAQGLPVVPTGVNATMFPPYVPVVGVPDLLSGQVAPGGDVMRALPPFGDSRMLARGFAGQAVNVPERGNADTIWHAPPLGMRPVPGYFQAHWTSLLGVERLVYFYAEGSEGANAVLGTSLWVPGPNDDVADFTERPWLRGG